MWIQAPSGNAVDASLALRFCGSSLPHQEGRGYFIWFERPSWSDHVYRFWHNKRSPRIGNGSLELRLNTSQRLSIVMACIYSNTKLCSLWAFVFLRTSGIWWIMTPNLASQNIFDQQNSRRGHLAIELFGIRSILLRFCPRHFHER